MNEEVPFSNREISRMFKDIQEGLDRVETQVKKTNGSVIDLKIWRGYIVGAITILVIIGGPLMGWVISQTRTNQDTISSLASQISTLKGDK